jgi:hypothetical protein
MQYHCNIEVSEWLLLQLKTNRLEIEQINKQTGTGKQAANSRADNE